MSTLDGGGEVAGYHVYWTLNPLGQPSSLDAAVSRPVSGSGGDVLVLPPGIDLDARSPHLPPGRYRLVPVDTRGTELERLPTSSGNR